MTKRSVFGGCRWKTDVGVNNLEWSRSLSLPLMRERERERETEKERSREREVKDGIEEANQASVCACVR